MYMACLKIQFSQCSKYVNIYMYQIITLYNLLLLLLLSHFSHVRLCVTP